MVKSPSVKKTQILLPAHLAHLTANRQKLHAPYRDHKALEKITRAGLRGHPARHAATSQKARLNDMGCNRQIHYTLFLRICVLV